uniref:Uncharacterized protein n=1 Tax=Echinococcus granulosus TaxID=6210 RepID=A0A068WXJ5_ECHGR|nr:hypothetical protein EgrG_002030900 [Echinococcus granulosus]
MSSKAMGPEMAETQASGESHLLPRHCLKVEKEVEGGSEGQEGHEKANNIMTVAMDHTNCVARSVFLSSSSSLSPTEDTFACTVGKGAGRETGADLLDRLRSYDGFLDLGQLFDGDDDGNEAGEEEEEEEEEKESLVLFDKSAVS